MKSTRKTTNKGGKKKRPSRLAKLLTWLQVIATALLWLSVASMYVSPKYCSYLSLMGIGFPIFLGFAVLSFLLTLVLRVRRSWIGFLGIALCFHPIRTYFPINLSTPAPKIAMKVVSYNVRGNGGNIKDKNGNLHIVNYIAKSKAHIFCMQESGKVFFNRYNKGIISKPLPYFDTLDVNKTPLGIYSKYPVVGKKLICKDKYGSNGAAAFYLALNKKDTLVVINCHLQSLGISKNERENYADIVLHSEKLRKEGHEKENIKAAKNTMFSIAGKIKNSSSKRAAQIDKIVAFIEENKRFPLLMMGDFNDTPISYAHHSISEHLTDCFRTSGNGFGRTFNSHAMLVRIDHIFCSSHFRPFNTYVDNDKETSDHSPIVSYLIRN